MLLRQRLVGKVCYVFSYDYCGFANYYALAFAETFVQAVRCSGSELGGYLSADGLAVENIIC
jgi:hypothetical protein